MDYVCLVDVIVVSCYEIAGKEMVIIMRSYVTGFRIFSCGDKHQIMIDTESADDVKLSFTITVDGTRNDAVKLSEHLMDEAVNYCDDYMDFLSRKKDELF